MDNINVSARTIYINDDIKPSLLNDILENIESLSTNPSLPIVVKINSRGGDFATAIEIYKKLIESKSTIVTFSQLVANSTASLIFLAGDYRFITNDTSIFIHEPLLEFPKDKELKFDYTTSSDISEAYNFFYNFSVDTIVNRTNLSKEETIKYLNETFILNAELAIKMGFATQILSIKENAS